MKLFIINSVPYGSTATISLSIAKLANEAGIETKVAFGYSYHPVKDDYVKIGGYWNKAIHMLLSRISGFHGVFSYWATYKLIKKIKGFNPDIIHIHNLHGWYINIPILVNYINKNDKKVLWTLHDCWALTGHCPHFDMIGCDRWKSECHDCPIYNKYPKSYVDRSRKMHQLKKKWFGGMKNLTIVTPSEWLKKQVSQSYLKDKNCVVINNGIDLNKFKILPAEKKIEDKFRIIGVSFGWDEKKGLDAFIQLSRLLDEKFEITLVGTDDRVDKILPANIRSIHRTQNQDDLVELYNKSDVFVNTTREENFPTVNIEALACGLPVITFNTGGSPEIPDETCGVVVPKNDVNALVEAIKSMKQHPIPRDVCRKRAMKFDKSEKFKEYIDLYEHLL